MKDYSELKKLAEAVAGDDTNWQPSPATWAYHEALRNPNVVLALIAEVEFLTESRKEARDERNRFGDQFDAAELKIDQLKAEVEALRRSLLEASEEVATWGAYASEYFQEKHDLEGCVARLHDAAMSKDSGHD